MNRIEQITRAAEAAALASGVDISASMEKLRWLVALGAVTEGEAVEAIEMAKHTVDTNMPESEADDLMAHLAAKHERGGPAS